MDRNLRPAAIDGDSRILLDSIIHTSEQMLAMVEAEEWELLSAHQAERDAVMERLASLKLAESKVAELRELFERARNLNDELVSKVTCQRDFARMRLVEMRRAENMQQGYGSTTNLE